MIAEMVVGIANADIESHTTEELLQVPLYISTILNNKVDNIQIAMPVSCIVTIAQP